MREAGRLKERHTERHIERCKTERQTKIETDRDTDRQTHGRQTEGQAERQTAATDGHAHLAITAADERSASGARAHLQQPLAQGKGLAW